MEGLETNGKCAGICTQNPVYAFRNVNDGVPKKSCGSYVSELFGKYGKFFGLITFGIALFLLINVILACCLFCHPARDK